MNLIHLKQGETVVHYSLKAFSYTLFMYGHEAGCGQRVALNAFENPHQRSILAIGLQER